MKRILAAVLAMGISVPAAAADVNTGTYSPADAFAQAPNRMNWTGVYIGGQIGYGNVASELSAYKIDGPKDGEEFGHLDGLNSNGFLGGASLGGDVQIGRFVFGVRGDYNISNVETTAGIWRQDLSVEEGDSWNAIFRLGYAVGADSATLIYGLGGYGQTDYDINVNADPTIEKTIDSYIAGVGVEHALGRNVTIGLEYQHWFGEEAHVADGSYPTKMSGRQKFGIDSETDRDIVMGRVNIRSSMKSPLE